MSQHRRALTIGVAGDDLTFAPGLVTKLAAALESLGYACTSHPARHMSTAELGAFVAGGLESLEPDLVQVIHVLTHGESAAGDATVYALGSDRVKHPDGDISHWLNSVQNLPDRPLTLFLLDLCHAGSLARLAWQTRLADKDIRAWVIAATKGDQSAYDGRFTQAVINILRAAANGELDIDPTKAHIPLQVMAAAIRREVNRLAKQVDGYPQEVTGTVVDICAEIDPPFFPNPRHAPNNRDMALRATLDAGLVPFLDDLDEGLDARHFIERGAGTSGFDGLIGCFAGREAQLKRLVPYLDRRDPGTLAVVTGSPGVGKSALLGVLVCAAHPKLRARTRQVWDRVSTAPYAIDDGFAAVHARQRSVSAIVDSLTAQLGLPASTTEELTAQIRRFPTHPVIVLDALDEADDGVAVMNELLLPLSAAPVRLLVGTRRYPEYTPLFEAASPLVDLDSVPRDVLEKDLERYVSDLLWATKYRDQGSVRGAFATEVAKTLAVPQTEPAADRWGEFLVAGLYTRYLVTVHPDPVTDPVEAERLGSAVPRTLPEVLELDLRAQPGRGWLRPVLTAMAHAKGQGMPASVLARVAAAFSSEATEPLMFSLLREALETGRFYLRQATDTDHTTLYRLFHQGLADYLRQQPGDRSAAIELLDRMLDGLGPADVRDWSGAEPYVSRHVIQHARDAARMDELLADPGLLMIIEPEVLETIADDPLVQRIASAHRDAFNFSDQPEQRRVALALNAVRLGLSELAAHAAKPLAWRPAWVAKCQISSGQPPPVSPVATVRYGRRASSAARIACCVIDGHLTAIVADGRYLHRVNLCSHQSDPMTSEKQAVIHDLSCMVLNGRPAALTVHGDHGWTQWDLERKTSTYYHGRWAQADAIACGNDAEHLAAVIVDHDEIHVLETELELEKLLHAPLSGHTQRVSAIACATVNGRSIAVSGGVDRTVRLWDLMSQAPLGEPLIGHQGTVTAIACTTLHGRAVAVTAGADSTVRTWDLEARREFDDPLSINTDWLAACSLSDGRAVAITHTDAQGVQVWDLHERRPIRNAVHDSPILAADCALLHDGRFLVAADNAGQVCMWNLETAPGPEDGLEFSAHRCVIVSAGWSRFVVVADTYGGLVARLLTSGEPWSERIPGTGRPVRGLREELVAGRQVVVLDGTDGARRVWDPSTSKMFNYEAGIFPERVTTGRGPTASLLLGDRIVIIKEDNAMLRSGHIGPVTALAAMELNGQPLVFSGGADATVQVWDPATQSRLAVIGPMLGEVDQIEVTTDGYLVVVAGGEVVVLRHHGQQS